LGYSLKKIRGENVLMAEPEKSFLDHSIQLVAKY